MINSVTYKNDLNKIFESLDKIEQLNGKSIFITGATGLIGSAIVDFLIFIAKNKKLEIEIFIGVRSPDKAYRLFGKAVNYIIYDATKHINLDYKFDYIIHAASPANPTEYVKNPVGTMLSNLLGTNELLAYSNLNAVNKFLYISSSEVYGIKNNNEPYRENEYSYLDILNDRACYPSSKRAAESLCISYANQYGINVSIVRPGHIYGPTASLSDTRASSQFFFDVLSGKDIIMKSKGEQIRSYCYVMDCVSSIFTVLLNGKNKSAYNISNPKSICSIYELACKIANLSNKSVIFDTASEIEKKGYNLMLNSSLDSSLITELGWKGQFDLETGVNHTLKILKDIWYANE